jgi:hypothetical protein
MRTRLWRYMWRVSETPGAVVRDFCNCPDVWLMPAAAAPEAAWREALKIA